MKSERKKNMPTQNQQLFNNEEIVDTTLFCLFGYKKNSKGMRQIQNLLWDNHVDVIRYEREQLERLLSNSVSNAVGEIQNRLVINWGDSGGFHAPPRKEFLVLNGNANAMQAASNKKYFFQRFYNPEYNLSFPLYFVTREDAANYIYSVSTRLPQSRSPILVERQVLTGHGGNGIRLIYPGDTPSSSGKLWTQYIKKTDEYRIHFFKGIDRCIVQRKGLLLNTLADEETFKIRNRGRGWVYCRQNVVAPLAVTQQAINFMNSPANDLDFGAIDIIYSSSTNLAHILEVNTAPGVEGETVSDYASAFKEYIRQHDFTRTNEDNSFKKRYQTNE